MVFVTDADLVFVPFPLFFGYGEMLRVRRSPADLPQHVARVCADCADFLLLV